MPQTFEAKDTTENFHDTDLIALASVLRYRVLWGCEITWDTTDLTFDVAAGAILHDGVVTTVAAQADAGTLAPDGTNPRWAMAWIDNTGTVQLQHGGAAASPLKPEIVDGPIIAAVLLNPGDSRSVDIDAAGRTFDKRLLDSPARILAFCKVTGGNPPTLEANSFNVSSVSRSAPGIYSVFFSAALAHGQFIPLLSAYDSSGPLGAVATLTMGAAAPTGSTVVSCMKEISGSLTANDSVDFVLAVIG